MSKRTPQQAYDRAKPSYTKVNEKRFADLEAGTTVLIPSPQDIEALIDGLSDNETVTFPELSGRLASEHGADGSCPVMTGMNLKTVVSLAEEAMEAGASRDDVVPFWKVIR